MDKLEALKAQADELGISYANNIGEQALQKKIDEMLGNFDGSDLSDEPLSTGDDQEQTVTIFVQEDDDDPHDVQLGVNGQTYLIQRGKNVEVPIAVYHVLNDAIEDHYDSDGNKTRRHAYPFSRV